MVLNDPTADYFISDHAFVACQLAILKPAAVTKTITFRKYDQIDTESFKEDIKQSCLGTVNDSSCGADSSNLEALSSQYNTTLREILDKHAPVMTKQYRLNHPYHGLTHRLKN